MIDDRFTVWGAVDGADHADDLSSLLDWCWQLWTSEPGRPALVLAVMYEAAGPSPDIRSILEDRIAVVLSYLTALLADLHQAGKLKADIDLAAITKLVAAVFLGISAQNRLDSSVDANAAFLQARDALCQHLQHRSI